MKTVFSVFLAFLCVALPCRAAADLSSLRIAQLGAEDEILFSAEHSYFDLDFDILGYAESIESRSTPERIQSSQIDLLVPLGARFALGFEAKQANAKVSRIIQPFTTETQADEKTVTLDYRFADRGNHFYTAHLRWYRTKQDDLSIDCYEYSGLILGGLCVEADVRLLNGPALFNDGVEIYYPALQSSAETTGWGLGVSRSGSWRFDSRYLLSVNARLSEIELGFDSKILNVSEPFLLNSTYKGYRLGDALAKIREEMPQTTPWEELSFSLLGGIKLPIAEKWGVGLSAEYFRVKRFDYLLAEDEESYQRNVVVDASLYYAPIDRVMVYLRGRASSNNVLGLEPMAYNRKSSKFFQYPFGQLSLGVIVNF